MVGAILTQNTNWKNVEKAIANLGRENLLDPHKLFALPQDKLAELIRPAGFFRLKAGRLRAFLRFLLDRFDGDIERMRQQPLETLRAELLAVNGIGPETADSILLYALEKPSFVIDAYTKRMLSRHFVADEKASYDELRQMFLNAFSADQKLFNEYHALIVAIAQRFCRPKKPKCEACPLHGWNWDEK